MCLLLSFYVKATYVLQPIFFFTFSWDFIISPASFEINRMPQIVLIQTNTILPLWRRTEKQIETNQHTVKRSTEKTIRGWVVHQIEEILSFKLSLLHVHTHMHLHTWFICETVSSKLRFLQSGKAIKRNSLKLPITPTTNKSIYYHIYYQRK